MKYNDIKDSQKQDEYLTELLKKQFDEELKEKWAKQLKTEYGVSSPVPQIKEKTLIRRLLPFVGTIAACLVLFFVYQNSLQSETLNAQTAFLQELNNPIVHPGITKGLAEDNQTRQSGITQFNEQNFEDAALSFSQIKRDNTEDQFYQAMSFFYLKQSDKAIAIFEELLTKDSNFTQEMKWYLSLAYLNRGDAASAKKSLVGIQETQWKFKEARQLLESL